MTRALAPGSDATPANGAAILYGVPNSTCIRIDSLVVSYMDIMLAFICTWRLMKKINELTDVLGSSAESTYGKTRCEVVNTVE